MTANIPTRPRVFLDVQSGADFLGHVTIELFSDKTPKTCENFRAICSSSYTPPSAGGPLTYKGSPFHRLVDEFMIQGGDITAGNGTGGASIYGGDFDDENIGWRDIDTAGLVCMANRGKGTNSSHGAQNRVQPVKLPSKSTTESVRLRKRVMIRRLDVSVLEAVRQCLELHPDRLPDVVDTANDLRHLIVEEAIQVLTRTVVAVLRLDQYPQIMGPRNHHHGSVAIADEVHHPRALGPQSDRDPRICVVGSQIAIDHLDITLLPDALIKVWAIRRLDSPEIQVDRISEEMATKAMSMDGMTKVDWEVMVLKKSQELNSREEAA
ncbi:MAG: hypothetical protein Q9181_003240 [Wetmoreana brouardii]